MMHPIERVHHNLRRRSVVVRHVEELSPSVRRVRFGGAELADFTSSSFDDHVKVFIPNESGTSARDYTPRRFDRTRCELEIDFTLHGTGPASSWAKRAAIGDEIEIGGPRSSRIIPMDFAWYVFVGDETGLPAIGRRIEELPSDAEAFVIGIVASAADCVLPSRGRTHVQWIVRDDGAADERCETAVETLMLPRGDGHVWIAAESDLVRRVREIFRTQHRVPEAWLRAVGYWRHGRHDAHETFGARD